MKVLLLTITATLICSCQTTHQSRFSAEESGFLGDYSQLKEGQGNEAHKRFVKEGVNWNKYQKVTIDPLEVWAKEDSDLRDLDPEELKTLLFELDTIIRQNLQPNFQLVNRPGEDTLRLRLALTEGEKSRPIMDLASNVIPFSLATSTAQKIITGKHRAVGQASIEVEVLDSESNERLAAAMDSRVGSKVLRGKFDSWDDVKGAFQYWFEKMNRKLKAQKDNKG